VTDLFVPLDDHPAYRQIANVIEERIVARSLRTGDPLPSEMDLARQFGVNRSTIREAIRELETHGLLGGYAARNGCASRVRNRGA